MVVENWTDVDFSEKIATESQVDVGTYFFDEISIGVFVESSFGILTKLVCCATAQTISAVIDNLSWPGQFKCLPAILGTCLLGAQSSNISHNI